MMAVMIGWQQVLAEQGLAVIIDEALTTSYIYMYMCVLSLLLFLIAPSYELGNCVC
jgi:hypothetical protein